jgi:hypothetical protein
MWTMQSDELPRDAGLRCTLQRNSKPASYADVLDAWKTDADFRAQFNAWLAQTTYTAFRWETPAVTTETLAKPFEFAILDCPSLARRPDREAFAEHFTRGANGVAVFANLGGDAILIVPCPLAAADACGHLATFVRLAPQSQRDALWQAVGTAMARRIGVKPVWLSTAGAGVAWLHVRLDDRPKYYGFAPYR